MRTAPKEEEEESQSTIPVDLQKMIGMVSKYTIAVFRNLAAIDGVDGYWTSINNLQYDYFFGMGLPFYI